MPRTWASALLLLFLFCCKGKTHSPRTTPATDRAFYYWQTALTNFRWHDSLYQSLHVKKIYYRFFDVDWNNGLKAPVPVSPLQTWHCCADLPNGVVPVVYITNETFKNLDDDGTVQLAHYVHKKVMAQLSALLMRGNGYELSSDGWWVQNPYQAKTITFDEQRRYDSLYTVKMGRVREIQFDCDWTESTRARYFRFLAEAAGLFKNQFISSTIRLYQYKYPDRAGVPPVKRGMLMCYNAGDINDAATRNSIFDKDEVMEYLEDSTYPLPLDYALPVFEWAVLYQAGVLKNILSPAVLEGEYKAYYQHVSGDRLTVTMDFVYGHTENSIYIRRGDEIRLERPNFNDVQAVAEWLGAHKNNPDAILALYHLNENDIEKHAETVETVFNSF